LQTAPKSGQFFGKKFGGAVLSEIASIYLTLAARELKLGPVDGTRHRRSRLAVTPPGGGQHA
jgi:hypothetical protein